MTREALAGMAQAFSRLMSYAEANSLSYARWTPPQLAYLQDPSRRKLLRAGNQLGKTWAGLAEVIFRAAGMHPFLQVRVPPVEIWIICTSWAQSVSIMAKFRDLCPAHLIRPTRFDARNGFGKDNPAVVFRNGSVVRFKTTNQGPEALAGATIDYIHIDEPCDEDVYRELDRRVLRRGGGIGLTLTPINRPTGWLRELAEAGVIHDHHARMTVQNLTPIGSRSPLRLLDGVPMDQAWIDEQWRTTPERYAGIVLDGDWETRVVGAVFSAFDKARHITDQMPATTLKLCLGVDHGDRDFKQVGLLVGIDTSGEYPRVHVLAEYVGAGDTTPEEDAEGILGMLKRFRWTWKNLDHAYGDKPHHGPVTRKSNAELEAAIRKQLRVRHDQPLVPYIRQVKMGRGGGRGSIDAGCTWLHRAMLREGHFTVHPRCTRLIESIERWEWGDSEWKDAIDALRYATWPYAMRSMPRVTDHRALYVY
jgi:phage terminase large subunit-like protein